MNDWDLLQEYVRSGSEQAFDELAGRYTDMVYSACLRQLRDHHRAEDAAQAVFMTLARKAKKLRKGTVLSGWLYKTARYASLNALRIESRRKKHEKEARKVDITRREEEQEWAEMLPVLDRAMVRLRGKERNSVILRFFEGRKYTEVGQVLGVSEGAAERQVSRALAKLRKFLLKSGVALSVAAVSNLLSANAVEAAPAGLAKNCTAAALGAGVAASGNALAITEGVMKMMMWAKIKLVAACVTAAVVLGVGMPAAMKLAAQEKPVEAKEAEKVFVGWRGNWTGKFPDANPPVKWSSISKTMAGLLCQAEKPEGDNPGGVPAYCGSLTEWLVLGPFPAADAEKGGIDEEFMEDEANWQPAEGEKVKEIAWEKLTVMGSVVDFVSLFARDLKDGVVKRGRAPAYNKPYIAYASTYVYSPKETKLDSFVRISGKAKIYVNSELVCSLLKVGRSGSEAKVTLKLRKGWNRVLYKVENRVTPGKEHFSTHPSTWFVDLGFRSFEPHEPETENIVWATRMPEHNIACPVVVGDKVFMVSDPRDLLCLNKKDGRIQWIRSVSLYDFKDRKGEYPAVERWNDVTHDLVNFEAMKPLVEELKKLNVEYGKQGSLSPELLKKRRELVYGIKGANKVIYGKRGRKKIHYYNSDMPTPVSDGKHIYVWFGRTGIVACYDFEGNRKWINQTSSGKMDRWDSPILSGGKLVVPEANDLIAFDAVSGDFAWKVDVPDIASLVPLKIKGEDFILSRYTIVRASDGKIIATGDKKWQGIERNNVTSPIVEDGILYNVSYHSGKIIKAKIPADPENAEFVNEGTVTSMITSGFKRSHIISSPLYHNGLLYIVSDDGKLSVVDAEKQKVVYKQDLGMGYSRRFRKKANTHASPVLAGKYIYVFGINGTTVVLEPGREYKEVARNKIEIFSEGKWGIYGFTSTPVADGNRLYIRSDRYLYCVGKTE